MKILGKISLLTILLLCSLNAEAVKLFDLNKQEFATNKDGKVLRFKVSDQVMIHTNVKKNYQNNSYQAPSKEIDGLFKLEFAKNLQKWTFVAEIDSSGTITFKDDNLKIISFWFDERTGGRAHKMTFQNFSEYWNKTPWKGGTEKNILKIEANGPVFKLYINDKMLTKEFVENFNGLNSIDINLNYNQKDYLYNIIMIQE